MSIDDLKKLCDDLRSAKSALEALQVKLSACSLNGHQRNISVDITDLGGLRLTECDRNTGYTSRCIRGREMILLGVKKVISALVDEQKQRVTELERQIAEARITP